MERELSHGAHPDSVQGDADDMGQGREGVGWDLTQGTLGDLHTTHDGGRVILERYRL